MGKYSKQVNKIPTYIKKLRDILEDKNSEQVIEWLPQNNGFQILNIPILTQKLLPKYFKHQNISSFVRQLNMYGFSRPKDSQQNVYMHPKFIRGNLNSMKLIKRRVANTNTSNNTNSNNCLINGNQVINSNEYAGHDDYDYDDDDNQQISGNSSRSKSRSRSRNTNKVENYNNHQNYANSRNLISHDQNISNVIKNNNYHENNNQLLLEFQNIIKQNQQLKKQNSQLKNKLTHLEQMFLKIKKYTNQMANMFGNIQEQQQKQGVKLGNKLQIKAGNILTIKQDEDHRTTTGSNSSNSSLSSGYDNFAVPTVTSTLVENDSKKGFNLYRHGSETANGNHSMNNKSKNHHFQLSYQILLQGNDHNNVNNNNSQKQ